MCILFCAIYTQTMLRKKNIAKKEGYSCAQNIADYLRIVLDYCLLGIYIYKIVIKFCLPSCKPVIIL